MRLERLCKKVLLSLIIIINCNAQEILTLEEAVRVAMENNYDIRIVSNNLEISKLNATKGNAGMLPKISANATDTNNMLQSSSQTRQDGTTTELQDAKNNNLNYGILLDWTIFDGFKMFARAEQLNELKKLGEGQLKQTIISKISDINITYFDLVQQQQQLAAIDSSIVISTERLTFAQNRFTIGKASKLDVLNAQVDLNSDQVTLLKQKQTYTNTKILLNQILSRTSDIDFKVIDTIIVDTNLKLNELSELAEKQNPELLNQIINKRVAELELKQIRAYRYPVIGINTGYNFSSTESSLGFTAATSSRGLRYGLTATLNLFDGFAAKRNERIAKLQIENSAFVIDQQKLALNTQLNIAFQAYLTNVELIDFEAKNQYIAKQNLDISLDKYKIGTINTNDFRYAQQNYITAQTRYNNAQFQAKLSEIALKELAGSLTF